MIAAKRLGRYRVGERIGTGGVADVFVAEAEGSEGFGKQVVLKCLRPHVADLPEVVEALIAEAQLAQRLQHGNIVQVVDFEVDDGTPFVVMEFVDGCTLAELAKDLRRRGESLPLEASLTVAERVAAALDYAHRLVDDEGLPMAIVHRDVKPSNILLSRDGLVKLTDFGVAKVAQRGRETLPGVLKGTPTYWAPEQAAGDPVDARADVFGLGVVLQELLPPDADDARAELAQVAAACVATKPGDRLPTMRALIDRLREWGTRHGVHPSGETIATLVRRAKRDKPAAVRVALDSALLSTTKGDATRQHRAAPTAGVPARSSWTRTALVAAAAAAAMVAIWGLVAGARPEAPTPTTRSQGATIAAQGPGARLEAPAGEASDADASASSVPERGAIDPVGAAPFPVAPPTTAPITSAPTTGAPTTGAPTPADPTGGPDRPPATPSPTAAGADAVQPEAAPGDASARPRPRRTPKAKRGLIKVNTLPWAEVEIDGKPYGRVPVEASLRVGRHRVVLDNPSKGRQQTTVTVVEGEAVSITRWPN